VMERTGGHYPAPLKILEVLRKHLGSTVERSLAAEARAAGELITSTVCKNLIHVFHLRERARKDAGVAPGTEARPVTTVGVLGAGVMGGGIAQLAAYHDLSVRLKDIKHDAVAGGLQHARSLFDQAVAKKKLRRRDAERKMELISGGLEYHGFGAVDVVVEAVVERLDVKRAVLREMEEAVGATCVMATNTSALRVDAMADALERPERFGGMHFFNPVHRMPLVEVVRGKETDDESVATLHRLAVALGKVPLVCNDGPGFVVNRILVPYLNEAGWLLSEGATIQEVDRAALDFGMPMGPLRLVDEIGLDIGLDAVANLQEALGERMAPAPPLAALAGTERRGRKNGRGFYRYEKGSKPEVDEDVYGELGSSVPPGERRGTGGDGRDIRARLV
ncbi:MAG TPA: 3-hydroxyacyl-CoA dehydrogenase NAD-binding domain-containing protein, partial [Longimicrobiales bacterium]|nr:3-hydroxyacyl-CoA dehydrogenase NAD-binding domain-containing protein [Longimicrobiales bacterium]